MGFKKKLSEASLPKQIMRKCFDQRVSIQMPKNVSVFGLNHQPRGFICWLGSVVRISGVTIIFLVGIQMHNKLEFYSWTVFELRKKSGHQVHVDGKQHSIWCSDQYCWITGLLGGHLQNEKSFVSRWLQDFRATSYNCASQYNWGEFNVVILHVLSWQCMRRPLSTSTFMAFMDFQYIPCHRGNLKKRLLFAIYPIFIPSYSFIH